MASSYKLKRVIEKKNIFYKLVHAQKPLEEVNKYLEWVLLQGNSHNSAAAYGYDLLNFFTWLDEAEIVFDSIEEHHLYDYIRYQREKQKEVP